MKSMIISEQEKKESSVASVIDDRPRYPYGLKLNVDEETYKKLDLKSIPQVGQKMMMLAHVEVCSVYNEKRKDDSDNISIGLQITEMEVNMPDKKESPETKLYGGEA